MTFRTFTVLGLLGAIILTGSVQADIRRNPTGVNVATTKATSLSIRFADDNGQEFVTTEALFCMRQLANGACDPATILGRLPVSLDRTSSLTPQTSITDIMTIPFSVVRAAVLQARQGVFSDFFYVRRFTPVGNADIGGGPGVDVFVSVTCRLTGGTSRTPLSFSRVELVGLDPESDLGRKIITLDAKNLQTGQVVAKLDYTGRGQLEGWWEVRRPGDPELTNVDLLPEAGLSEEERAARNHYYRVKRFSVTLPNTGSYELKGPTYNDLPSDLAGAYQLLLRLDASRDREALSALDITGEDRLLFAGGVAAFPVAPLEYRVPAILSDVSVEKLFGQLQTDGASYSLSWQPVDDIRLVVGLELRTASAKQTYFFPATNHISYLPMSWANGAPVTGAMLSLHGPDKKAIGPAVALELPSPR